jgi:hypothetical protein
MVSALVKEVEALFKPVFKVVDALVKDVFKVVDALVKDALLLMVVEALDKRRVIVSRRFKGKGCVRCGSDSEDMTGGIGRKSRAISTG